MKLLVSCYLAIVMFFNRIFNNVSYSYTGDNSIKTTTLPDMDVEDNGVIALFKFKPHVQNNIFELLEINKENYTLNDIETNQTFTVTKDTFDLLFKRLIIE